MKPIRHSLFSACLLFSCCLFFASSTLAGHLESLQFKLQRAGLTEQGRKIGEFKSRFPGLVLVIDRWLPASVSPEIEALLANLVLYMVYMDSQHGVLSSNAASLEQIAHEQLVAIAGDRESRQLPKMTQLEILFELFFVIESYRLSIHSPAEKVDDEVFKVALESYLLDKPYNRAPFVEMEQERSLEQMTQRFNLLSLLMMLAGSGRSSTNAQLILGAIKSLTPSQQHTLSQRILELIILRGDSLHAFQRWLESQLEAGRSSGDIFSQLLDNDGSVEGFEATPEKIMPDVRSDWQGPRTYIQPSLMKDPAGYGRYQRPAESGRWQIPDAESQVRSRIHKLKQERDALIQGADKEEPDWFPGAVPVSNRALMDEIIKILKFLESGEVKGDPGKLHGELLSHLERLNQAYPSKQKFSDRINAVTKAGARKRFTEKQQVYSNNKDDARQSARDHSAQYDYELALLRIKLTAMRLQRGQGRVVDLSETQLYAQDLKSLRMQSQHHGRRFGTLTAQQEREISELCTHCRNIMRTEEGQYLDLRTEQWETLPEPYREAASKIMDYIIQRFKQLPMPERSGQAAEAPFLEDQTADKSVFTEPHLLSDAFNRLKRSDTPNEPSLLPAGVCRCPVAKDNYCFYQALTTAMELGITGEALFQQIVLLAQNTLTEFPQTLSLLNSILANSMSTVEELAALAFVEYAGVQMWGHTGMLPLIAWWFGSSVLVTTPATWEGNGALLFLADGTWEFVQTEAGGGLHTVEILQTMFPSLAVIENADNHWSVLRVENVARYRRR